MGMYTYEIFTLAGTFRFKSEKKLKTIIEHSMGMDPYQWFAFTKPDGSVGAVKVGDIVAIMEVR